MAFNLKKQAQVKNYDKMLGDQTSSLDLDADNNPTNYNGILDSDRVGDNVDQTSTYENHLDAARTGDDDQVIAEKAMDKADGLISRHDDGEPLMDYHKKGEQEQRKVFNMNEYNKATGERILDKNPGEQIMEAGNKPMTGNVQPSQLLSNYDTRAEFEKAHKMASQKLTTADAILYSIYRTAADERRELTDVEKNNVEKISQEKALVLAQMAGDHEIDNAMAKARVGIANLYGHPTHMVVINGKPHVFRSSEEHAQHAANKLREFLPGYDIVVAPINNV